MLKSLFKFVKSIVKGYTYTKNGHCNDPKLLAIIDDFNRQDYRKVKDSLLSFAPDYRDFAFVALGEVKDSALIETWVREFPNDDLPLIVLAYHKVAQGAMIRGVGSVNSVSAEDLSRFKTLLKEAQEILLDSKETASDFDINKDVCLLTIFKAIDLDSREVIHETFQHGLSIDPAHIGLHIAYFVAISEKWGGSREELTAYFDQMPDAPSLLVQCIQAIYYWDLVKVYQIEDEETEQKIKSFILAVDQQGGPKDNLYRYELYLRLYWLSSILLEGLEDKYYQLVKPYWDDK